MQPCRPAAPFLADFRNEFCTAEAATDRENLLSRSCGSWKKAGTEHGNLTGGLFRPAVISLKLIDSSCTLPCSPALASNFATKRHRFLVRYGYP